MSFCEFCGYDVLGPIRTGAMADEPTLVARYLTLLGQVRDLNRLVLQLRAEMEVLRIEVIRLNEVAGITPQSGSRGSRKRTGSATRSHSAAASRATGPPVEEDAHAQNPELLKPPGKSGL